MDIVDVDGVDNIVLSVVHKPLLLQQNQYVRRENGKVWFCLVPVSSTSPINLRMSIVFKMYYRGTLEAFD